MDKGSTKSILQGKNDCNAGMLVLKNRVAAARSLLQRFHINSILFTDLYDIRYLTGFTGSEGLLLLGESTNTLLTDSRYTTQAHNETSGCEVVEFREKFQAISSLISRTNDGRIGFQPAKVSFSFHGELSKSLPSVELVPLGPGIDEMRSVKDSLEIDCLARTAKLASDAFYTILDSIKPGETEKNIALGLEFAMRAAGADDKAFDLIVASGERGALPHGRASSKSIRNGELVTIDFGAVLDGYNSDETVTLAVGTPDSKQREIFQIVKDAHDMALEAIRPGVFFKDIDAVARDHIARKGFGEYFGHGLGHGVGLDVHEKPVVSFRSDKQALEGMVFTVEPGIYLPGWGGVRIEDTVCVTSDGCRILTAVSKNLIIV